MKIFNITLLIVSVAVAAAIIGHRQRVASAPAPVVGLSPEQTSDSRPKGENKNGLGTVGFVFGLQGFIFGLAAIGQVSKLKKEVEELKSQIAAKS